MKSKISALFAEFMTDLDIKPKHFESWTLFRDACLFEIQNAADMSRKEGFRDALFTLQREWEKLQDE